MAVEGLRRARSSEKPAHTVAAERGTIIGLSAKMIFRVAAHSASSIAAIAIEIRLQAVIDITRIEFSLEVMKMQTA